MKLHAKIADTPTGRVLALFDEQDRMLPCQTKLTLVSGVGDLPRLVVEFVVDGDGLALKGAGAPHIAAKAG